MAWYDLVRSGMFSLPVFRLFAPSQGDGAREKPRTAADANVPRNAEGTPIPLVYGTVRMRSPIVIRVGDFMAEPMIVGGTKIGEDYFIALRLLVCRGNSALADTTGGASLVALYVGDKKATLFGPPIAGVTDGTSHQSYSVTAPGLLELPDVDGNPRVGDSVLGDLYFYRGRYDQVLHTSDLTGTEHATYTSPRRGKVMISLKGHTHSGDNTLHWHVGPDGTLPAISPVVYNPILIPGYEAETAPIGNGDANPMALLYDLLTNPRGGLGIDPAALDLASFGAAGSTLIDEGHGMSLQITDDMDARDAIDLVLSQVDAVLREEDPTLIDIKLIRPVDASLLPIINEANVVVLPELGVTTKVEAVTEVKVKYVNSAKHWDDDTESARDDALLNALGGKRNVQTWDYPGCSNQPLAAKLAARQLNFLSRSIRTLSVSVDRSMATLRAGDPFRFQWSSYGPSGIDIVFRVAKVTSGTLEDGTVRIEAVQDRWAVPGSLWQNEQVSDDEVPAYARPVLLRTVLEAPRWIQLKAFEAGTLANVDAQRSYSVAWPEGADDRYRVDLDGAADLAARAFPGRFELDDVYLRTAGPYDTTGIQIRAVAGWTPTSATATQIATEGRNLIQIDDEILAFETATFVSGTTWTLDNVWRGVLDTVPADHAEGAAGYVLGAPAGSVPMGSSVLVHGTSYEARTLAAAGSTWTPAAESPTDTLVATSRVRRPYPVDNLAVNGSQAPAALSDDGVTMTWAKRDRTKGTITRPDAATETPEAGTAYHAVGYKGTGPLDGGTQVVVQTTITSGTTRYPLGAVGHGALEVGVDSALAVTLPDGTTPTLTAWQVPTLEIVAPRHRNLIINGKFDDASNNWTISAGTASTGSGAGSLGGGGTMITAAAATTTLTFYQDVPISGYDPADLRALLTFAAGPTGADANDTFAVTVTSRDASSNVLDTATIAATHPAAWDRYSVEIANLDAATASIRVSFTLAIATSGDGGDTHVDIGVTECRLRVGDFTGQLLSDAEFAALTAWTQSAGTWQILSATLYGSAQYTRPNDGASAQLRQAITPAAGWERNATAELVCGRMNDGVDDTGTVTLQALDSGGTVIGSSTTGAEASTALGGTNVWAPRRLTLDLPSGTVTVRVQLDAARVTGTPLNACFGDFDLRLHKELDPVIDLDHEFAAMMPTQRIPASRPEWVSAWPNIAPPNVAMYAGRATGELGGEPLLETVGAAYTDGEFVCVEGRADGRVRSSCYDLVGGSVRVAAVGDQFMNFRSTENWAIGIAYKSGVFTGSESGLIARFDTTNTIGWELGTDAGGAPQVNLVGASSSIQITGTAPGGDPGPGVLRIVYLHHDATADELTLIDDVTATTASTVGVGEFHTANPVRPTIGVSPSGNFLEINGQIARIYAWRGTNTPSVADLQSTIDYATIPSGMVDGNPRTGYVITVDGSDADGLVGRGWQPGTLPFALDEELGGVGVVACPSCTNLVTPDLSAWSVVGTPAIETIADPLLGLRQGRGIASASGDGLRSPTIAFGGAATVYFTVAYYSPDGSATFHLENNSGTSVASTTLPTAATPTITSFSLSWTGATSGNGKLRITSGSTGRAVYVSSAMYAGLVQPAARTIPIGTPGALCPSLLVSPTTLHNAEGELYADVALVTQGTATIARAWNGTNGNDNRQLRLVSGSLVGKHSTGAGTNTDATASLILDTATRYQARLRWQRVGLRDGTASQYSSVRGEQGIVVDTATGRTADWTPSATALQQVDIGHDDGSDVAAGAFARVRLRAREPRL